MGKLDQDGEVSSLERQLFERGVPEWADCILTEREFCAKFGVILEEWSSQEEEEN